ncbi:MAG TPA: DUF3347 domain-containing protein [Saprospiraceae bacterium]|nr:DUF3347 domain-containing protein [Saprospiraceae bacterium]
MKTIITVITMMTLYMSADAQQYPEGLVNGYLKVKDALIINDSKQAAALSASWLKTIETAATFKEKEGLTKSVMKITNTNDIETQRKAFAEISLILWPVVKNAHQDHRDLYYMYCPMKQTYWISAEPEIRNPYYGAAMLTCGKITDKKQH